MEVRRRTSLSLGLPVTGDAPGPPGDIPSAGRERSQKKSGRIFLRVVSSPTPRRGEISPAAGDIPGRVEDIPGRSGISPRPRRGCGMSPTSGDIPGLWRGASPTGSGISPALRGMSRPRLGAAQRTLKSTHTRAQNRLNSMQNVVCVTPRDRPRALAARLWPPHAQPSCPGARRGPASHTARRGEARREAGRVSLRPPCAPLCGAPFGRADEPPRTGQREME